MSTPVNAGTTQGGYSIGAVARLTGISTHTLRIWERRYQTVVAERTPTGRRSYSRANVEKLSLLKLLVDQGFSIGQIAGLSLEELRERRDEVSGQVSVLQSGGSGAVLRVAALTGFSLDRLRRAELPVQIELVVCETQLNRFRADVKRSSPDILLLEFAVIDKDSVGRIADLRSISGAQRIIVLFNFAHRADIEELAASQVELIRSPVTTANLLATIRLGGTVAQPVTRPSGSRKAERQDAATLLLNQPIPPRRFTEGELARFSDISTPVGCECPHHISDLVQSLTAFEVYSEQCESQNEDDAALHHYLHATSARARAIMEEALNTVITEDNFHAP